MPKITRVEDFDIVEVTPRPRRRTSSAKKKPVPNLLAQATVPMTVFAQDPLVTANQAPVLAQVPVPAGRLQRGPRSHRFHVVDIGVGNNAAAAPVALHAGDAWVYADRWADKPDLETVDLVDDREFRAQNVFAVASYTLALFEQHLGRPIPWHSAHPQLYLIPQARIEANAFYSREHNAVLFGWLPAMDDQQPLYTALSYDVIAHEVSHAILDGLRPEYTEPGLPDQLAFHEALADLVAMLSVFTLKGVAKRLLDPEGTGTVSFPSDAKASRFRDPEQRRQRVMEGRAQTLKATPLTRLAEQIGARRASRHSTEGTLPGRYPSLRRSVDLPANADWLDDPRFAGPHRRAEVLVACFLQTLVSMWAGRLHPLRNDGGLDAERVAEEGVKSARHLLAMLLRALDYLPPVELEFADVVDTVLTADRRLAPDDEHHYRDALKDAFGRFGITPPEHRIVDEDGVAAPLAEQPPAPSTRRSAASDFGHDPDASDLGIRYEHLNLVALRSSADEVYQFIWNNSAALEIDVRLTTRVTRVLGSSRVGPDGAVVTEILADYVQTLRTTASNLPPGIIAPAGMPPDATVELWGGGVLVFDQFGRFRLHQRKPILEADRQSRRLKHLFDKGIRDAAGGYGTSDGTGDKRRFSLLHTETTEDSW